MGISFPYTGSLFFLSFVAWVPLLLIEQSIEARNLKSQNVFVHAYLTFFLYNLIATWWIYYASAGGVIMAVVANALLMAIAFQLFHFCKKYLGRKEGYVALLALWLGFEYFHYSWELSWPWLNLGNTFSRVPWLVQWYSYSGVLGGTLWILLVNFLAFRLVKNVWLNKEAWSIQRPIVVSILALLIIPSTISLFQYLNYEEKGVQKSVMVLQPNMDPYTEKFNIGMNEHARLMSASAEAAGADSCDLILAPETALPFEFDEERINQFDFYRQLKLQVDEWKTPWLIGVSTRRFFTKKHSAASRPLKGGPGFYETYNASMMLLPGEPASFIHKSKLVLGVEKVPFIQALPFLEQFALDRGGASGTLGIESTPKTYAKPFNFAPVICYESVYGEFVGQQIQKGAQLISIITNDGWWRDTPGYRQHFSFARLRAIENRRDVARSANTGTSGFINQRGDVVFSSEYNTLGAYVGSVHLNTETTFYAQRGDVLGRVAAFLAALMLLYAFVRKFKNKHKSLT